VTSSSSTGRRVWPARGHAHLFRRGHRHPSARPRQTRLAGEPGLLLAALVCSGARDHLVWKICDHEAQIRCTESIGFSWSRAGARGLPCVGVGRGRPRQSSAGTATPPSRQIWRSRSPNPVVTEGTSGLAAIDSTKNGGETQNHRGERSRSVGRREERSEPVRWQLVYYGIRWEGKFVQKSKKKAYLGELKAYLQATDHTSSNIISRDLCVF
jgi:hypothetical protein